MRNKYLAALYLAAFILAGVLIGEARAVIYNPTGSGGGGGGGGSIATSSALTANEVVVSTGAATVANATVLYVPSNFAQVGCAGSSTATTFQGCIQALYQSQQGIASGTTIWVTNNVTSTWTNIINFNINGLIPSLKCTAGVILKYTGAANNPIALQFNYGDPTGHLTSDDSGCTYMGQPSLIAAAQTNNATTTGVFFGGNQGAPGINFHDNNVNGFMTNLEVSSNTYLYTIQQNQISGWNGTKGHGIQIDKSSNSGESCKLIRNFIGDPGNSTTTGAGIYFADNGLADCQVIGGSIDDAQIYMGIANPVLVEQVHFENSAPATYPGYAYIYATSSSASALTLIGNTFDNDASAAFGQPPEFVEEAVGTFMADGNYFDRYGSQGAVTNAIDHSIGASIPRETFCGNHNQNGAYTNLANQLPDSIDAANAGCWSESANSYAIAMLASGNNINSFYSGSTVAGTFDHSGNWTFSGNANAATLSVATTSQTETATIAGNLVDTGQYYSAYFKNATSTTSSTTVNWNNGNEQSLALGTSTTITFSNVKAGGRYLLMLVQDSTGSRTVTWPSSVQWSGGTAPTLTTTASKLDIVTFVCAGISSTDCYGGANLNYSP